MGEVVLAACTENHGILATDLRSGAVVATFDECAVQPSAFGTVGSSTGYLFAAQAKKAIWHAWAWGERKPCYRGSLPERMTAMAFSPDAALSFGGSASGSIYIWQAATGCLLRCWPAHFKEVTQLLLSADMSFLVSASSDANVHLFLLGDVFAEDPPRPFHSWSSHSLAVTSLALLPGPGLNQVVVSASLDRSVRLWDVGSGKPVLARSMPAPVLGISVGPGGSEVLCALKNGELRTFSTACGESEGDGLLSGHTSAVLSCAFNIDGSQAASCSEADRVRIWEMRTRQCVSQAHTTRNVQIGAVRIVQRSLHVPPLPAFQPFQRMLARLDELPPVPVSAPSGAEELREAMLERVSSDRFIEKVILACSAQASGSADLAGVQDLQERLAAAEAAQARWAALATELYGALVESGLDSRAPIPAVPLPPAPAPPSAPSEPLPPGGEPSSSGAASSAAAASASSPASAAAPAEAAAAAEGVEAEEVPAVAQASGQADPGGDPGPAADATAGPAPLARRGRRGKAARRQAAAAPPVKQGKRRRRSSR